MNLSELTAYAEEKYHIREEQKWDDFRSFSVLTDPETRKWVALLMRQWDYETGNELCRCDIKCGRQILSGIKEPYVTNAFRMRGEKWVGVIWRSRKKRRVRVPAEKFSETHCFRLKQCAAIMTRTAFATNNRKVERSRPQLRQSAGLMNPVRSRPASSR